MVKNEFTLDAHRLTYQWKRLDKKQQDSLMMFFSFFFIVQIFKTLLQALTKIQYELFMVLSTLGSFFVVVVKRDTYIHVIFFLSFFYVRAEILRNHTTRMLWWICFCDTEAMQRELSHFTSSPAGSRLHPP